MEQSYSYILYNKWNSHITSLPEKMEHLYYYILRTDRTLLFLSPRNRWNTPNPKFSGTEQQPLILVLNTYMAWSLHYMTWGQKGEKGQSIN